MKNIIIIVAIAITLIACDKSKPQVQDSEIARQSVIDSMKMQAELQLTRQRILDSVNLISSQNQLLSPVETPNVPVRSTRYPHTSNTHPTKKPETKIPDNGTVKTDHTAVSNSSTVAAEPTPAEKKKMSGKTKGAIIGAAAGIITGAAAGAIINKDNPVKGGIIGGAIGGAIGSGVGYGGGNAADKKKAQQDSINKANADKNP